MFKRWREGEREGRDLRYPLFHCATLGYIDGENCNKKYIYIFSDTGIEIEYPYVECGVEHT